MPAEPYDLNPYAAPVAVAETSVGIATPMRVPWSDRLIVLQSFVIVISIAVAAYEIESILFSGPIFSAIGLAIAFCGVYKRDHKATLFGSSAIAFALRIVFLINYYSWGPINGKQPILMLMSAYTACALPMSAWLVVANRRTRVSRTMQPCSLESEVTV